MSEGRGGSAADISPALDAAAKRLERAVSLLDGRLKTMATAAESSAGPLFEMDRSKLAAELDESQGRLRALEAAGQEASAALALAIDAIRLLPAADGGDEEAAA